jgi:CelD/BcsL family acetyltransferase involved in cellulose biosynthesis
MFRPAWAIKDPQASTQESVKRTLRGRREGKNVGILPCNITGFSLNKICFVGFNFCDLSNEYGNSIFVVP